MEMEPILGRLLNQDGIFQTNELRTLEELSIESLDIAYKDVNKNLSNCNTLAQQGSYTKKRRHNRASRQFAFGCRQSAQPPHGQNAIH